MYILDHALLGIIAGWVSMFAFVLYYVSIIRGKTIPNRATWFILTIVGFIISSSYYSLGARDTIWVSVSYVLGPLVVFLLSIKYGENQFSYFDKICLFSSIISLILWIYSGSALIALTINILIDFFGILPTIRKIYYKPYSEALTPWIITSIASIINILAINDWIFSIYVYPVYMVIFNLLITFQLLVPKIILRFKR